VARFLQKGDQVSSQHAFGTRHEDFHDDSNASLFIFYPPNNIQSQGP
jgi:hypothetical protein